jgi:hypothetical protein
VRSAFGTRLTAEFRDGETLRTIQREVTSGGSFGCNPLTQHLGLARATRVERLVLRWPKTGRMQEFRELEVDQHIQVVEGEASFRRVNEPTFRIGG